MTNVIFIDEWCSPLPPLELDTMVKLRVKKQGQVIHQTMRLDGLLNRCGLDCRADTLELLLMQAHKLMASYWGADSVCSLRA